MKRLFLVLVITFSVMIISRSVCRAKESTLSQPTDYEQQMTGVMAKASELERKVNGLERQLNKQTKPVFLTGCVSKFKNYPAGYVLKFDDIRSSFGINGIERYKATGRFEVEEKGMYLVMVSVSALNANGDIGIYNNGDIVTKTFKGSYNAWGTESTSAGVILEKGDNVWLEVISATYINPSQYSCLTIVKIY